jgi:hypothetical protein
MAAANCMKNLVNVKAESEAAGTSGVVSGESPRKFNARKRIEPGAELYVSYGQSYFMDRKK